MRKEVRFWSSRLRKKWQAKYARQFRQDLVHGAGCVDANCLSKWPAEHPEAASDYPPTKRVSVPRSLRVYLGRWVEP